MSNNTIYSSACTVCRQYHSIEIDLAELRQFWGTPPAARSLTQNAFPSLPASDREFLLSSICPSCWDRLFKEK